MLGSDVVTSLTPFLKRQFIKIHYTSHSFIKQIIQLFDKFHI